LPGLGTSHDVSGRWRNAWKYANLDVRTSHDESAEIKHVGGIGGGIGEPWGYRLLTEAALRALKPQEKPYKRSDSGGLFVLVSITGARLWRYKYRHGGVERLLALGAYPEVSLREAAMPGMPPAGSSSPARIRTRSSARRAVLAGSRSRKSHASGWRSSRTWRQAP
jgi:hypothetical protein